MSLAGPRASHTSHAAGRSLTTTAVASPGGGGSVRATAVTSPSATTTLPMATSVETMMATSPSVNHRETFWIRKRLSQTDVTQLNTDHIIIIVKIAGFFTRPATSESLVEPGIELRN